MLNIDVLTLGNEFKDADGNIFKVASNFSEKNKLFIELEKQEEIPELIPEK